MVVVLFGLPDMSVTCHLWTAKVSLITHRCVERHIVVVGWNVTSAPLVPALAVRRWWGWCWRYHAGRRRQLHWTRHTAKRTIYHKRHTSLDLVHCLAVAVSQADGLATTRAPDLEVEVPLATLCSKRHTHHRLAISTLLVASKRVASKCRHLTAAHQGTVEPHRHLDAHRVAERSR